MGLHIRAIPGYHRWTDAIRTNLDSPDTMKTHPGARDRCCTPWNWLVRLLFAFLLAAALMPRVFAQTGSALTLETNAHTHQALLPIT
jgi:hypothetical protein